MDLKKLRQNKWFVFFSNIYVIILTIFVVWMVFFDTNSLLTQIRLRKEINTLKRQKEHLQKEIRQDKGLIRKLRDSAELEKFAREKYYFKKDNEEVYMIEYEDSLKNKNDE